VQLATENGKVPECDKKMLTGITQKLLVRTNHAVDGLADLESKRRTNRVLQKQQWMLTRKCPLDPNSKAPFLGHLPTSISTHIIWSSSQAATRKVCGN
jgi:hypothetical protein